MQEDWTDFKKTFTQRQEESLWQYFIDHSIIRSNGYYGIQFYIRDIDDFWKRLYARYTGQFSRYDKLEKQHKNEMLAVHMFKKRADIMSRKVLKIGHSKDLKAKVILWLYRKSRDFVFGYKE